MSKIFENGTSDGFHSTVGTQRKNISVEHVSNATHLRDIHVMLHSEDGPLFLTGTQCHLINRMIQSSTSFTL